MKQELLNYYLTLLDKNNMPSFLVKYLNCPSLIRLKDIGYFCGMDYASHDIYDFKEEITRYNHSLTTALLVYKLTKDKKQTIAGLFHDISTPCFSHVIDYMNKDYEKQETTEAFTKDILRNDLYLLKFLKEDNLSIIDIEDFKNYSIVDSKRPKLCADRIDGIILNSIGWTKNITKKDIKDIVDNLKIYKNEDNEIEIGVKKIEIANKILSFNKAINEECHSNYDNYMMQLLADITKYALNKNYFTYNDLYIKTEKEIFTILETKQNRYLEKQLTIFKTITKKDLPETNLPPIKQRTLHPIVNGKRMTNKVI